MPMLLPVLLQCAWQCCVGLFWVLSLGLAFSERKIIPWNTEQTEIFIHSVGIPPVSRNGKRSEFFSEPFRGRQKTSEFRFEPFCRREKHSKLSNFGPNHSSEDKNSRNSFPNYFAEEKNPRNFVLHEQLSERKKTSKPYISPLSPGFCPSSFVIIPSDNLVKNVLLPFQTK
jgi:hypothetical protein